ncbi:DnaD domain-containing protein [Oceanobacillus manasiensis]|uniref:DnaD domain-containing protein n=1 Tax=Oceanobacillus manasiensis TaxID=586413 RepID=UPI0005A97823|nr:DnaD domain protein [Oceanobacillus manasiensis]
MKKSLQIQQILLDQIHIPIKLITSFQTLGLDERDVMLILQIQQFQQKGIGFPTPAELSANLTMDEKECSNILRKFIQKGILVIEQDTGLATEKISEVYSLNELWETLYSEKEAKKEEESTDGTLFILFEQEFGRPLSPFEIETINGWLDEDKQAPSLIKAALRESVLMGKLNFKYIDRILREWQKKGIHSVEQARDASKKFHGNQTTKQEIPRTKRDTSFYYNWLEGED